MTNFSVYMGLHFLSGRFHYIHKNLQSLWLSGNVLLSLLGIVLDKLSFENNKNLPFSCIWQKPDLKVDVLESQSKCGTEGTRNKNSVQCHLNRDTCHPKPVTEGGLWRILSTIKDKKQTNSDQLRVLIPTSYSVVHVVHWTLALSSIKSKKQCELCFYLAITALFLF